MAMTTLVMVGCASYQGIYDRDAVRNAALYFYSGTFSTPQGERAGTIKVQRRLQFTRGSSGQWTQSAPPVEIARNASWKGTA